MAGFFRFVVGSAQGLWACGALGRSGTDKSFVLCVVTATPSLARKTGQTSRAFGEAARNAHHTEFSHHG